MENKETISLKTIIVDHLRHWRLFLGVFLFSFIPAILYLTIFPRTYEFNASIQIQAEKESSMASFGLGEAAGLMKSFGIGAGGGSVNIDDEMAILASNRLLGQVTLDLGLNVDYSKPYSLYRMYRDAPLKLTASREVMTGLEEMYLFKTSVSPGLIKVKVLGSLSGFNESFEYESLPAVMKIKGNDFVLDYNGEAREQSFSLNIRCFPISWTAETLSDAITIEEAASMSHVLALSCSDHSMARGKDLLNTLIAKYNDDASSYKRKEDKKTLDFVDGRIDSVLADLSQVELDLQAYKTNNNMTLIEADVTMYGESMMLLQKSIIETEVQKNLIDALSEYIKNPENTNKLIPPLLSPAEGEKGGAVTAYNEMLVERNELLANSSELNPMYITVDNKVKEMRKGVYSMIENSRHSVDQTLKALRRKEKNILSERKTIPAKEREYVIFERNREILQGIYLMLIQKREETNLSLSNHTDRARLIEPAFAKKKPLGPRKLFAAIGMLVFTLVVPIGYLQAKSLAVALKNEYKRTK